MYSKKPIASACPKAVEGNIIKGPGPGFARRMLPGLVFHLLEEYTRTALEEPDASGLLDLGA
jgi:hypothetical protein